MAYVGSVNNVNTQGAAAWFNAIKTALLAAGWELMATSDGVTYQAGNTPDLLPNVAAWNVNNAWCRLREPGGVGGREYIFMRGTGVNATTGVIKYSRSTGFVGGTATATQLPTTGANGDGVVWWASGANIGFGFDATVINSTFARALAGTTGYVGCTASNTAVNGVYGWWLLAYAAGTGATTGVLWTEGVQVGSCPVEDQDPSYRMGADGNFFAYQGSAPNLVQYWQCYGLYSRVSPETYFTNCAFGMYTTYNSAQNFGTVTTPRTSIGLGVYGTNVQTYPVLVGGYSSSIYPKGYTTGLRCINVALNNLDTLNLSSTEPQVVINNTYGFVFPWVQTTAPIF